MNAALWTAQMTPAVVFALSGSDGLSFCAEIDLTEEMIGYDRVNSC
jgi:hypothetical protein